MDSLENLHRHTGSDQPQINPKDLEGLPNDATKFLRGDGTWIPNALTAFASDTVQASANTQQTQTGSTYVKKKEVRVNVNGTVRVKVDAKGDPSGLNDYLCRVYVNGVAVGSEMQTGSASYTTVTESSVTVVSGDLVQLYTKCVAAGTSYVQNFKVCYSLGSAPEVLLD